MYNMVAVQWFCVVCLWVLSGTATSQKVTSDNHIVGINKITYQLYHREGGDEGVAITPNTPGGLDEVNPLRPTVVYLHGFSFDNHTSSLHLIRQAYLFREDVNFFIVDWAALMGPNWNATMVETLHPTAQSLANFTKWMYSERSVKLQDVHFIGFGMGAQIAGMASKYIENGKVGRITALDPVKFTFGPKNHEEMLDPTDAVFVQVIHTSGKALAYETPLGHADFYPAGGTSPQPLCIPKHSLKHLGKLFIHPFVMLTCSHLMALVYYAESLFVPSTHPGHWCDSWAAAAEQRCSPDASVFMGYATPSTTRGVFYVDAKNLMGFQSDGVMKEDDQKIESGNTEEKHDKKKKYYTVVEEKWGKGKTLSTSWESMEDSEEDYDEDTLPEEDGGRIVEFRDAVIDMEGKVKKAMGDDPDPVVLMIAFAPAHSPSWIILIFVVCWNFALR